MILFLRSVWMGNVVWTLDEDGLEEMGRAKIFRIGCSWFPHSLKRFAQKPRSHLSIYRNIFRIPRI